MGGVFGLEIDPGGSSPACLREGDLALSNARSGLFLVARHIRPRRVWLPSYLCPALIAAVQAAECPWEHYPVDVGLRVASDDWMAALTPDDAVVLIEYFGFPTDAEITARLRDTGAWLIRDACQALYATFGATDADFALYSPRKFAGVPDGGILAARSDRARALGIERTSLSSAPDRWSFHCLRSALLRREFDLGRPGREWFELFRANEACAPIGAHSMGETSLCVLRWGLDHRRIGDRRRANYQLLASRLGAVALRPELPADVVPLGFPIRASNREELREALFREQIYAPVHWLLDGKVHHDFDDAGLLAGEELTLPCDQRYGEFEMERMARVVASRIRS